MARHQDDPRAEQQLHGRLTPVFPANRKGKEGDVLKVGCFTCHNGVQKKPLYGVSMLKDYIDALTVKGPDAAPDYTSYVPGKTRPWVRPPNRESHWADLRIRPVAIIKKGSHSAPPFSCLVSAVWTGFGPAVAVV